MNPKGAYRRGIVGHDEHDLPFGRSESHVGQHLRVFDECDTLQSRALLVFGKGNGLVAAAGRTDAHRTRAYELGCVGDRVVREIERHRVLVDGDRPLAHRAPAVIGVRSVLRIGGQVP